jgi:SAM-dependent methyltransferase
MRFRLDNYQKWKSLQSHWDDDEFLKSLTPLMKLRYRRLDERVEAAFAAAFAEAFGPSFPDVRRPLLLDLGCGRGEFAAYLKSKWGNAEPWDYLGIEPSSEQLAHRDIPKLGKGFLRGLAEKVPLADMCAHGVLVKEVLDHCFDPQAVFREARRLLKPGGLFVVTLTNDRSWFKRLLPSVNRSLKARQTDHLHFFGPDDLVRLAREASFDRVSVETYNHLKFPRFLESLLGPLGTSFGRAVLDSTDALGKALLPGMGGGMILKASTRN